MGIQSRPMMSIARCQMWPTSAYRLAPKACSAVSLIQQVVEPGDNVLNTGLNETLDTGQNAIQPCKAQWRQHFIV